MRGRTASDFLFHPTTTPGTLFANLLVLAGETRESMSSLVARTFGKGLYFARKPIAWKHEWIEKEVIAEGKRGCVTKTRSWFNDEGVQLAAREWISGAGEGVFLCCNLSYTG